LRGFFLTHRASRRLPHGPSQEISLVAQDIEERLQSAMRRRKRGTLKSGSGKKVTSRKQAIAIGLSEARQKGKKVATKKS
jgi:Family of unknown function (DUF6496)